MTQADIERLLAVAWKYRIEIQPAHDREGVAISDLPDWLDPLIRAVADAMSAHGMPGRLGVRYREEGGAWEVLVYQLPVELVGGRHDGEVVSPGFTLDLERVRSAFTRVDDLSWQAHPLGEGDEGPCVSVEGRYAGRDVWLRVLAYAPEDEEAGERFDTNRGPRSPGPGT